MEMNRTLIRRIKADYPPGTRIELIFLDDPYAKLPPRLQGVVALVDDAGTIHTQWDNGSTLGLVPGVDRFRKVDGPAYKRRFILNPLNLQELRNTDHTDASRRVVIEKVVELDTEDFAYFAEHLRECFPFIHDNIPLMHMDSNTLTCHCILVKEQGASDGILVESEGYDYAKYAAYWEGDEHERI